MLTQLNKEDIQLIKDALAEYQGGLIKQMRDSYTSPTVYRMCRQVVVEIDNLLTRLKGV